MDSRPFPTIQGSGAEICLPSASAFGKKSMKIAGPASLSLGVLPHIILALAPPGYFRQQATMWKQTCSHWLCRPPQSRLWRLQLREIHQRIAYPLPRELSRRLRFCCCSQEFARANLLKIVKVFRWGSSEDFISSSNSKLNAIWTNCGSTAPNDYSLSGWLCRHRRLLKS